MSVSSSSRRRTTSRQYSAEEQALNQISKEAESRLAAKRAARAEAREIRIKEIERQQKEEEEKQKSHDVASESASNRVKADYTSLRRDSNDSSSTFDDVDGTREMKEIARDLKVADDLSTTEDESMQNKLRDLEDKYKKSMVTNAQLDNEKQSLVYKVELMKDQIEEQEEAFLQLQKEYKDKSRDLEMLKRDHKELELELANFREQLIVKDRLIEESGLVIISTVEGEYSLEKCTSVPNTPLPSTNLLVSSESAEILSKLGEGTLDDKVKKFAKEIFSLQKELKKMQVELEEEKLKKETNSSKTSQPNGPELQLYEVQREASKQIHEYKLRLQKAEQDITNLEGTVSRLDSQVRRYKADAEEAERIEDELKTEKRKLQRELREAQNHIEELQNQNKHQQKRLEKMKQWSLASIFGCVSLAVMMWSWNFFKSTK